MTHLINTNYDSPTCNARKGVTMTYEPQFFFVCKNGNTRVTNIVEIVPRRQLNYHESLGKRITMIRT